MTPHLFIPLWITALSLIFVLGALAIIFYGRVAGLRTKLLITEDQNQAFIKQLRETDNRLAEADSLLARVTAEAERAKADLEIGRRKFSALEHNAFWRYEQAVGEARLKYEREIAQLKGVEETGLLERAQNRWLEQEANRVQALRALERKKAGG
jgi:hypothetical protein